MIRLFRLGAVPLLLTALAGTTAQPAQKGIQITELPDRLRVEIDGALFTEYYFKDVPRPFCYPIIGPGDTPTTRNWPIKDAPDEERDHKHHRSLWFTHGAVNGHDFWSEDRSFGKVVHDGFVKVESGKTAGLIQSRNKWLAADGTTVCTDRENATDSCARWSP